MSKSSDNRGFTLVEMLVTISVLSFMLVAMAQMTSLAGQAYRLEQNRIDNFSKARAMLNLLTDDLQRAVFRGDLPAFGTGAPATTPTLTSSGPYYYNATTFTTAFYTRQPGLVAGTTPVRDVSLVKYAINTASASAVDKIILQRSDLNVPWTGGASNLIFQGNLSTPLGNVTPQEIAPGVVGFGIAFRRADGSMIAPSSYTGYNTTAGTPNPVVAVDVCLAVIGKQSLAELTPTQVGNIQTALNNDVTAGNLGTGGMAGIKAVWDQQTLPNLFATKTYPKDLGGSLKTFECWVACTPF